MPESPDLPCVILARRRGRPPAPPTVPVSIRLRVEELDRLIHLARRSEMKVAAFVRDVLRMTLRE